jgi:hypothetical protein
MATCRWIVDSNPKDPVEPTTFWVNPFGVAWPLIRASDLIRVNAEGQVVDGGPVRLLNTAGEINFRISVPVVLPRILFLRIIFPKFV